ncbi:hypothetical protein JKP88DRAFT_206995 [Tribonema minus]|uniref:Fe2OG dioxygenase domain-containing protein n=1 Tax=Tribonema minus TaxID=303371 RepID=A0A836CIU8_9STRA|nr:hypothetical protein JKP88DRAFT_206995 [Tribonema minus]
MHLCLPIAHLCHSAAVKKSQHAVDALWALGLLGQPPSEGTLKVLLARLAADASKLQPGQLSAIVWSLQRMGAEHLCPQELKRPLEALKLPFSVHQRLLPASWSNVESIMQEVEFRRDEIRLGEGGVEKVLEESRLTAWQSCTGLSFSYSGKTMAPQPMTPTVIKLREALAEHTGQLYDGVLINLYMTPSVGMRFHQDPGQGEEWTEETAVVSVGETRQFVMRRVDDHADRHVFYVSSGDCVRMFGACQRDWQHCVKVEGGAAAAGGGPRVSFVFKQSMAHAGGLSEVGP